MYPFHSESDRNYHALVGLYVGCWAGFEYGLYRLIGVMSMFLGKPVPSRAIPLNVKIKTIRDVFSAEADLAQDLNEALALCVFAEKEAEFRHALIHGVNAEIHKRDPWYTLTWRPEKSGGKHEAGDILHITEKDLYNHYENVGYAGLAAVGIVTRLLKKIEDGLQ